MKLDGVTMETTEPTEAAAEAEPSMSQDNVTEQAPSQPEQAANGAENGAAPGAATKANSKPETTEPKVKPQTVASKVVFTAKTAGTSGSNAWPGAASHRTTNNVHSSNNNSAKTTSARKTATTTTKASVAGAVPKRPVGTGAVSSTVKNQTKAPDKKPAGPARTTSVGVASTTSGTKTATVNGAAKKKTAAETVNAARPKTTATASRPASSTAPKPSTSTAAKAEPGAGAKTTKTGTGPSTSRPAFSTSRPTTATSRPTTAATRPTTTATAKTAASRVTTAPSTGRTAAVQPPKTAAAKKDVGRPPSAAAAKRPATATSSSAAAKMPEPSKAAAGVKPNSASKWSATTKTADSKLSHPKTQQLATSTLTKKPGVGTARVHINNKLPSRTQPAARAVKPANGSTPPAKRGAKPTQAVSPFTSTKKTGVSNTTSSSSEAQSAAAAGAVAAAAAGAVAAAAAGAVAAAAVGAVAAAAVAAATVLPEVQAETTVALPQESSVGVPAPEEISSQALSQNVPPEVTPQETGQSLSAASPAPQSPVRTALPENAPPQEQLESSTPSLIPQEQVSISVDPSVPPVAPPPALSEEPVYLLTEQTPSATKALPAAVPPMFPPTNLNEDEDEEEREGSQQVSVSEMSGTTQPTEESRPGSAGLVGGSAWRAGGALFSELDSEEVSGSQQGASELSAPGLLEGTESMDDLGDGSLKGAIDMEGASAGSPDFEKVPDIPVNDFEEDDYDDDNDRVCDMDVGSERIDEPQRPRHDNDVEDEEDDDVEMASEGVTESGLESYGNADEDDFAEDERLDNLNRVAQPPPPPQLPSALAAQWDQPNPFADPWAEPLQLLQPQQLLEHMTQPAQAAAASPLVDPWQADSETPTQSPAQPWLELGTAPFVPENQQVLPHSSAKDGAQMYMDQPGPSPMQTLAPAPLSAPGMSLSSTLSSEISTPEELCDYNREGKLQPQDIRAPVLSPQLDLEDLGIHLERGDAEGEEDAEAETLPADEVLGGPATAPTSNPSSSSVTEDEASDTEGEAQLDDSLEAPVIANITFDSQPSTHRCLSTVEEGEEPEVAEGAAGEDSTPPSATSLASYGFDTMTTASSSNAQSTGESCIRSPGIFSLEELPEEAKEPGLLQQPLLTQPFPAEQQYIECGKQEAESAENAGEELLVSEEASDPTAALNPLQQPEENPDDIQPPYYSAICEKTENSFAGFTALPHTHRREHSALPRTYCDIVKPVIVVTAGTGAPPRLTCADLPPRNPGQQALSPQLRRLEQHQRQLLEMQQRREQQSRVPPEEAEQEQERKRREEEEQRRKKEEAEEEIKRNEERKMLEQAAAEEEQRRELEMQLQQQQEELKQRQQIMQWQQELQQQSSKGQTVLLSPSSGLCTIYEALENSDEETDDIEEEIKEPAKEDQPRQEPLNQEMDDNCERLTADVEEHQDSSPSNQSSPPHPDSPHTPSNLSQDGDSPSPPESPERPPPLDLDWGKKVDIVQQLINQTLLLNGDGCSSLLLLPGGTGGTLSPLESSLWPSLLPPLTPPSATVTSVSSFSPEATGSSPQGEWTVVELETHH